MKTDDEIVPIVNKRATTRFKRQMEGVLGLPIKIASDDECEEAELCLCILATDYSPFKDNLITNCADCGIEVQHRPHAPTKPPKVCLNCVLKLLTEISEK